MILGAIGTGKTSACMYPYVEQLLRWRGGDEERRYILDDSQIDRDIGRLKAALNDPPDVLVITSAEYREHCIQKPWTHWFREDVEQMVHPYEADLRDVPPLAEGRL